MHNKPSGKIAKITVELINFMLSWITLLKMNSVAISFESFRWDRKPVVFFESCRMNINLSCYVYKIVSKSFIEKSFSATSLGE